ncbi:18635_t:CDS:2, partial [Funneliformis geosporum]
MSENQIHVYFNRNISKWNIKDFLDNCKLIDISDKIIKSEFGGDCGISRVSYLSSLKGELLRYTEQWVIASEATENRS